MKKFLMSQLFTDIVAGLFAAGLMIWLSIAMGWIK